MSGSTGGQTRRFPILGGIVPIDRSRLPMDIAAGVTLAALGIPEVMGYTKIAGMPVITGLYTILIPIAIFAVLGSSRHLVVGADSATAAILAAGLAGMAPIASPQYVALAGMLAIITGGILILARLIRLGFLADFLSRSVLIGFLTGVGIQVAMGQVAGMLGVAPSGGGAIRKFVDTLSLIPDASVATVAVSASVIVVIVGTKMIDRRIPGALIAVVGAIFASWKWDFVAHGVTTLGKVPSGLPSFGIPDVSWTQFEALLGTAGAVFIVILAQSAATSRAYAAKYSEEFDENVDLDGLGAANIAAGLSGTFVVNGSPTKTQMVDGAGGKSQLASLTTAVIVLVVLLFLTVPLQYMPNAVLASVVFLIGLELVDVAGMTSIYRLRRDEFVIAALTALVVIVVGVEQGVLVAIVVSVLNHLRFGYHPNNRVLVPRAAGGYREAPVAPDDRTEPGLVVYRFSAGIYYANATRLTEEVLELVGAGAPNVQWLCIDTGAVSDVDYSGGETLRDLHGELFGRGVRLVLADVNDPVRSELDRFGITGLVGDDAYFAGTAEVIASFQHRAADERA